MAKILTIAKKKKIENVLLKVLWEQNDPITRGRVKSKFTEILGFDIQDISSNERIDRGFAEFRGYDPKTKRVVDIIIGPNSLINSFTEISYQEDKWLPDILAEIRRLKMEAVKTQNFDKACD